MLTGALPKLLLRQPRLRQAGLTTMLRFSEASHEAQIGFELMSLREQGETLGAQTEMSFRFGKPRERRSGDLADGNGLARWRA